MDTKTKELIAVGASISAHCQPCLEHYFAKARDAGASEDEILEAVLVGKLVNKGATAQMNKFVSNLVERGDTVSMTTNNGCGCK